MICGKSFLFAVLSIALLSGCTTVEEQPSSDNIATTTLVDGVKVTSVVYKCRTDQSESELQGKFEKPFLVEFFGQEQVMLVERSGSYLLINVKSASGSKYVSVDGMQTFWEKGDEATITLNNETFTDCFKVKE
ncbi:MliC family protein [Vibrio sp.]|uniref:MliC family protein n=1 Tax=Vibrio sp. TaxID=678 RepID=UPI003AA9AFB2